MKKILLCLFVAGFSWGANAQDSTNTETQLWKLQALYGLNGTQSSFVNWSAGGRNNITLTGYISASASYAKEKQKWDTDLELALGGLQYIGVENSGEQLQKTDDKIDLASTYGIAFNKEDNMFFSAVGGFKTQFLDGFVFPNDSVRVSKWMAPGYVNLALGLDYTPNDHLTAFISPLAAKWTFVMDETLANQRAFGVEGATYDSQGVLISKGQIRSEFGAYAKFTYDKEILKNVEMKSSLELFSNYRENPENIDVNADVLFTFKVNSWLSASLNWTLIYDHDISILDNNGGFGPRTQFKSVLGLGVSYTMKNFEDKKK